MFYTVISELVFKLPEEKEQIEKLRELDTTHDYIEKQCGDITTFTSAVSVEKDAESFVNVMEGLME